jgi:UDP-N-acetylglucosamine 4,6-dehydratase
MTFLKNKSVLVTGGAGSIGNELVKQLLEREASKVIIFSRDETKHFIIKKRILDDRFETVVGDIRDYGSIKRVFEQYDLDLIYHAAAMKHVVMCEDFPIEGVKTNIFGTQNIVDLAKRYDVPDLITISTDKSTNPVNVMGATKFIAERITMNAGYSCVRFGNVANSRGSVIPVFVDNLLNGKPLIVSDLDITRFIMEIPEAVDLILKATELAKGNDIFILKMKAFKLGDLLEVMVDRIAPKLGIFDDVPVEISGLVRGEKLHEELINSIEANYTYKIEDIYLVLKGNVEASNYEEAKKVSIENYTSKDVEILSKDEIEIIVMNYIEKLNKRGILE